MQFYFNTIEILISLLWYQPYRGFNSVLLPVITGHALAWQLQVQLPTSRVLTNIQLYIKYCKFHFMPLSSSHQMDCHEHCLQPCWTHKKLRPDSRWAVSKLHFLCNCKTTFFAKLSLISYISNFNYRFTNNVYLFY